MNWLKAFQQDLDADVGGGNAPTEGVRGAPPAAADVNAGASSSTMTMTGEAAARALGAPVEASPAQKRKLTTLFNQAGIAKEAQKAIVLWRCRSEKATKDGASQLITDLLEGATHDALIAEVRDAARTRDAVAIRAAKLIPSDTPADTEGLPELGEEQKAALGVKDEPPF